MLSLIFLLCNLGFHLNIPSWYIVLFVVFDSIILYTVNNYFYFIRENLYDEISVLREQISFLYIEDGKLKK